MKTKDYLERMAALGIDRGAFAEGFEDETIPNRIAPRTGYSEQRIGKRVRPELEDLSRLNDKRCRNSQESGRRGGKIAQVKLRGKSKG